MRLFYRHETGASLPIMAEPQTFASVALPTPLRKSFHYRIPDSLEVHRGARVVVPFGQRRLVGVVLAVDVVPEIEESRIKSIAARLDPECDLPEPLIRLCLWAAEYYQYPVGEVFTAALPSLLRKAEDWREISEQLTLTAQGKTVDPTDLTRAPAQRRLLALISEIPRARSELKLLEVGTPAIRAVVKKDWARWQTIKVNSPQQFSLGDINYQGIAPTDAQQTIIDTITKAGSNKPLLLYGVTGSGKTEVYLRAIEHVLKQGKQAIVLVPEIGLTPQTINRFQTRFEAPLSIIHSSLTEKERALSWKRAKRGESAILLGTRSAIFTPMKSPGIIIVDEEHDASYKQHDGFRYSARDLAVLRSQFENIPVILGSATPSLESLHNTGTGKYDIAALESRPPGVEPERYELLDTRHLEQRDGFTRGLKQKITATIARGEQVLVFINRRGFAPVMMCNDCGWIANCRRCDARLTYHLSTRTLVCHHCGSLSHNIIACQSCRGSNVAVIGQGTQRVEQTLSMLYPDVPVVRVDRDSTRKKGAMDAVVKEINKGEPAILVGTQLLAKGHHFPEVTLVAIMDIDGGFYSADFRAVERLGQMILQVGGRAGRAEKPGTVVIQTEFASHPLLMQLVGEGYQSFATTLLKERSDAGLPPFTFHAIVRAEAMESEIARRFLSSLEQTASVPDSTELLGPIPAMMEKRSGRYRQMLIVSAISRSGIHKVTSQLVHLAEHHADSKRIRWSVDVDPVDLF